MKHKIMKIAAITVMLSLATIVLCSAIKKENIVEFSDVPKDFWAYETIRDMTKEGLFVGTTEPVEGIGTFSPDKVMSRAEFITVALSAAFPEEMEETLKDSEIWWKNFYKLALNKDIVKPAELDGGDLEKPMSREEMAMVLVRTVELNGEKLTKRVETSRIADYATVGSYYKSYVRDCFSFGLICGVDEIGTFAPTKSLTRAEGAEVLCRLLRKDRRIKVDFNTSTGGSGSISNTSESTGIVIPWENGGKSPNKYTWEEFEALSDSQQEMFFEWFESSAAFEEWMSIAQNRGVTIDLPWENGGKLPNEYTWEEFEALSDSQQEMFFEWFESSAAFEEWMSIA